MRQLATMVSAGLFGGVVLLTAAGCESDGSKSYGDRSANDRASLAALGSSASPDRVMTELKAGNKRYVAGDTKHPRSGSARIRQTAGSQKPFVSVLSCADSRVPVERVFDQGVGDVFVVRVAGNVAGTNEIGTLEYGVGPLDTNLVVVMGHTSCGAVNAVVTDAQLGGSLPALVAPIKPAVNEVRQEMPGRDADAMTQMAVRYNVMNQIEGILERSESIADAVRSGEVDIVGAVYSLETGEVEWLGEHPRQAQILSMR